MGTDLRNEGTEELKEKLGYRDALHLKKSSATNLTIRKDWKVARKQKVIISTLIVHNKHTACSIILSRSLTRTNLVRTTGHPVCSCFDQAAAAAAHSFCFSFEAFINLILSIIVTDQFMDRVKNSVML